MLFTVINQEMRKALPFRCGKPECQIKLENHPLSSEP